MAIPTRKSAIFTEEDAFDTQPLPSAAELATMPNPFAGVSHQPLVPGSERRAPAQSARVGASAPSGQWSTRRFGLRRWRLHARTR